jgi:hypothetical protein
LTFLALTSLKSRGFQIAKGSAQLHPALSRITQKFYRYSTGPFAIAQHQQKSVQLSYQKKRMHINASLKSESEILQFN